MSVTAPINTATTPTTPTTPTIPTRTERTTRPLWRATVAVGAVAAVATTVAAAALHGAGVPFEVGGEMIPLAGFAQMTLLGAVIGGVLLAVLNRRSATPHHRFLQTTTVLTALSCVPSVAWPPDVATKLALVSLHVLAAVIVVPALARHARHAHR